MITVKRNTGFIGSLLSVNIYINGQEGARIKEGHEIEVELPDDEAKIYVSSFENHSKELLVKEGDVLEITNSSWFYLTSVLTMIAIVLTQFILPSNYAMIGSFLYLILYTALVILKNGFELKVIST